jgi:hypothetical protein
VQHGAHLIGWQVNVRLAVVARHKAMTITVPLHRAFDFVQQTGAAGMF